MKREPRLGNVALRDDPHWYKDAVIYQLHIKSFYDANGDGIGDFAGLIEKLDYIAELGVDTLWVLPFYPSPRRDDGYDIAEYRGVHPDYGTIADVRRLIAEAHARGIRVITELVINHTSDQHPWFKRACLARPGSSHRNYYVWSDTGREYDGTRIIFVDTEVSNWTWEPTAGAYYWHRFYSHQPDLNFDNPQVLRSVLGVMHFWLGMGVDGLRLDAVPYLVEREGTSNENLPETHAILRRIRADLDAKYRNRLLLAEANQWPEDVQQYFGAGDECHMAFHFPLMPRMYMAIAREDRFPITDILSQTPQIPDACQWAIFLRNHDELTLEMVTDSERDYLWEVYASDRRARLNLGIRRRLAPLLERDRRRIELMNSLLLSMPGTPVIYYGDEIGMGDNIHLGDRDGVRTPMQWSYDRNGGFSRADPELLTLPAIQGALYGYESVNVESQARDPHSLLNWMRRLIATRRSRRAFGRGTIEFLHPTNRKVLAYLREHADEAPLLCVANLSRASQAVELDLSRFAGRTPVELLGGTAFPAVGQLTYLLTLPPYGFYWFELTEATQAPRWNDEASEQLPEFTTFVWRAGAPLLDASICEAISKTILPRYLPRRRWFAGKNAQLRATRLRCVTQLMQGTPEGGPEAPIWLCEVDAHLDADGADGAVRERQVQTYLLPLTVVWEQTGMRPLPIQLALARVRRGGRVGYLVDAFASEALGPVLAGLMQSNARVPVQRPGDTGNTGNTSEAGDGAAPGVFEFESAAVLAQEPIPPGEATQWMAVEQTNSSLAMGNSLALKLVRQVVPGVHPEAEMLRRLSECGFANSPEWLGEVRRRDADGTPHTLAILQRFVGNQGNGWNWGYDTLSRLIEALSHDEVSAGETRDEAAPYLQLATQIGKRLGEMHLVLAQDTNDEAFSPIVANDAMLARWTSHAQAMVSQAFSRLAAHKATVAELPDANAQMSAIESLLGRREEVIGRLAELVQQGAGTICQRVHGDFHLGQVLVTPGDVVIIDFEGEPAREVSVRREKTSPLRDVAGLLRSLDYVGRAVASTEEPLPAPMLARREALLRQIMADASQAFLDAYARSVAYGAPRLAETFACRALLDAQLLEKAAYEIVYECANRPAWLWVPLAGFESLVARLLGPKEDASS
ncbi:maltose alpha-D-glucosyltransferase [Pandoraea vervacti]|uniref:Maltokinase n=1 Tax=Pandoraea vervacti TaxID=656178 RepID=A0ABM5SYC4_9BURK|nr:maltose alpha-D-glucosyltransferase [Pandoraea vervacti]AJP57583.1 maltose alpha-D-glucosyltransferase [Pandoraea vervacti]